MNLEFKILGLFLSPARLFFKTLIKKKRPFSLLGKSPAVGYLN